MDNEQELYQWSMVTSLRFNSFCIFATADGEMI